MIRKFVTILAFAVLAGPGLFSQQTPQNPQPSSGQQQSGGQQEASEEETARQRKTRPHDYQNWVFNVGAGANLVSGTTMNFVKGGGAVGAAGVAHNGNKHLGLRLDFFWANLPLRNSALQLAQAPSANNHVYAVNFDPIINIPVTKKYSGYIVGGPSFYHRSGKLDSSSAVPGSPCWPSWPRS